MKKKVQDFMAADVTAIHQLEKGEAGPEMQKRAFHWIIMSACATYDQSYVPQDTHETAFNEGRRFCGKTILKMLKEDPAKVRSKE